MSTRSPAPYASANEVFLRGAVAAVPVVRTLPSGDELCAFRINVPRASDTSASGRTRVDSIDCASTRAVVRRAAQRWSPGDVVEITGALHRRFWRGAGGAAASRYEVDVVTARRAITTRRRSDA
jgi:single-strand DNA-binding protein